VCPTTGLGGCGKFAPTGIGSPDRHARSESLHRLRYPDPRLVLVPEEDTSHERQLQAIRVAQAVSFSDNN